MEKKIWSKPEMNEFAFAANEYVAACGDSGSKYYFKCDAGGGYVDNPDYNPSLPTFGDFNKPTIWQSTEGDLTDANGNLFTSGSDRYYYACGDTHEASTEDEFVLGRFYANGGNDNLSGAWTSVYVWIEKVWSSWTHSWYENYHATTNIDIEHWETNKS